MFIYYINKIIYGFEKSTLLTKFPNDKFLELITNIFRVALKYFEFPEKKVASRVCCAPF